MATGGLGSYAFALEPGFRLIVKPYDIAPPHWPRRFALKAAVLADIHACVPWMPASRVRAIAERTNALAPDIIFLLGDFSGGHSRFTEPVMPEEWGEALSILRAPLGVYSILGNHDWRHGVLPHVPSDDAQGVRRALVNAGITVLENDAVRLQKEGQPFWVAGLGDQLSGPRASGLYRGCDDLPGTLARITDRAPVILLAHEPQIFRRVPDRVSLTLAGHMHGGQVVLPLIGSPLSHPRFGLGYTDLLYGHIVENERHLIISGGLGTSHVPIRFLQPPEIVEVNIGPATSRPLA
ncbi:metallophosphoesterase [Methylocapsa palsarum]|uniref:metallophosphoesterase n=1 Tax=Methylocapsa palsarum TaxID=1612308 RepID=UPI003139968F